MRLLLMLFFSVFLLSCADNHAISDPHLAGANRIIEKTVAIPPPSLSTVYHLTSSVQSCAIESLSGISKIRCGKND